VDGVAAEDHLEDLLVVRAAAVGDDDGALGVGRPPGVVVDVVVLDGDVVSLVGPDGRVGAVVHDVVGDAHVGAADQEDAAARVLRRVLEAVLRRLGLGDLLVHPLDLETDNLNRVGVHHADGRAAVELDDRLVAI